MISSEKIRVGAVNYLNTKPLVFGLEDSASELEISYDFPSRLADRLAAGQLDVALIPSIEFFQNRSYTIVSDACIGCRGPVLSVKLLGRKPFSQVRSVALDAGSRTSIGLVHILLDRRFGVRPRIEPLPIGATAADTDADAVLLIGDRAMDIDDCEFAEVWDLGDEWCRWTGLPFVFAMWTAHQGVIPESVGRALSKSRDEGLANLDQIAANEAPGLELSRQQCAAYLRDNLYFHFGPLQQQGLDLFQREAIRLGLAPEAHVAPIS